MPSSGSRQKAGRIARPSGREQRTVHGAFRARLVCERVCVLARRAMTSDGSVREIAMRSGKGADDEVRRCILPKFSTNLV